MIPYLVQLTLVVVLLRFQVRFTLPVRLFSFVETAVVETVAVSVMARAYIQLRDAEPSPPYLESTQESAASVDEGV